MDCLQAKKARLFQNNEPCLFLFPADAPLLVYIARLFHPGPKELGVTFPFLFLAIFTAISSKPPENHCIVFSQALPFTKKSCGWLGGFLSRHRKEPWKADEMLKHLLPGVFFLPALCTLRFTNRTRSILWRSWKPILDMNTEWRWLI